MKTKITILLLLISTQILTAQPENNDHDNYDHESLTYQYDNTLDLIIEARQTLQEKFIEGDLQKVKEIKDYLLYDEMFMIYIPLTFNERFTIYF